MTMKPESHFLKHEQDRAEDFRPNPRLVELIDRLRAILEPVQQAQAARFTAPRYPVVTIVGSPRSGTTLTTQILAATGAFAYPTNFLSRLAYAPQIGAMIQQMLFNPDYDFRDEFADVRSSTGFSSTLGKTGGAMAISEFFHFWRRFFPNHDPGHIPDSLLSAVEVDRMRAELAAIESVFDKPFVSKGMMMQYNLDFFAKTFPELFVLHIRRRPRFLLQSVMTSRRRYYGTDDIWWSVKPREFEWLSQRDPVVQVAGQVYFTVRAIDRGLEQMPAERQLVIEYERLCDAPRAFYEQLRQKMAHLGCSLDDYRLEESFTCADKARMPQDELDRLEAAYEEIAAEHP